MKLLDVAYAAMVSAYLVAWMVWFAVSIRFNKSYPRWYQRLGFPVAQLVMIGVIIIPLFYGFRYSLPSILLMPVVILMVVEQIKKRVRIGRLYEKALAFKRAGVGEITIEDLWADVSEADQKLFKK